MEITLLKVSISSLVEEGTTEKKNDDCVEETLQKEMKTLCKPKTQKSNSYHVTYEYFKVKMLATHLKMLWIKVLKRSLKRNKTMQQNQKRLRRVTSCQKKRAWRNISWGVCAGGEQGEGWLEQADSEEQSEDEQDQFSKQLLGMRRSQSWSGGWNSLELF